MAAPEATVQATERRNFLQRVPDSVWALIALAFGLTLGILFPERLAPVGASVSVAFVWLGAAAPYLIFFTLTPAIGDMLKTGSAAKFAGAVSLAYVMTTLVAGFWAILILTPVFNLSLGVSDAGVLATLSEVGAELGRLATGSNLFISIWWSALCAVGLHFGQKSQATAWFSKPTATVLSDVGLKGVEALGGFMKRALPVILFTVGVYIPTKARTAIEDGIRALEASGAETQLAGAGWFGDIAGTNPVAWYFIALGVAVLVLWSFLAFFGTVISWYTGVGVRRFFRDYLLEVYPFAWATSSSVASIPLNLDATKRLGIRKEVREFIVPLGATVNLDGTMMVCFVLTVVAGILTGYKPSIIDLAILLIPLTVVTIGTPGIPSGIAIIAPPVIANFLPIPVATVISFQAIWFAFSVGLSDMFRTGVNTCDNGLLSMLFDKWYPKHFMKSTAVPVGAGGPSLEAPEPEAVQPAEPEAVEVEEPRRGA